MSNSATKIGACLAGFGIAQVIDLGLEQHLESGALINLFPDWPDERFPLYVYYASRNHVPAKVRKFIDFIMSRSARRPELAQNAGVPARAKRWGHWSAPGPDKRD